jgi:hypothetical protein
MRNRIRGNGGSRANIVAVLTLTLVLVGAGIVLSLQGDRDEHEKKDTPSSEQFVGEDSLKQIRGKFPLVSEEQFVGLVNDFASSAVSIWSLGAQSRCQQAIGVGPTPCVLAMVTAPLFRKPDKELGYQKAILRMRNNFFKHSLWPTPTPPPRPTAP